MKKRSMRVLLFLLATVIVLSTWTLAALPKELVPVGSTVGIRLNADGLMVVGFDQEGASAARDAGMKKGDIIKKVNGVEVSNSEEFKTLVSSGDGKALRVTVDRGGKEVELAIAPQKDQACYRLGIYVRDSMAGIGTVTFYDPATGVYGALGHGVNDTESMILLPLESGEIMPSSVVEVKRGASGTPGVLKGTFDMDKTLGTVEYNTEHGIFGKGASGLSSHTVVPVAAANQIKTGKATILANIDGTSVQEYQIEITKLFPLERESGRNMLLTITDARLLKTTGGIVQGMSGSPILQDGRLVGAVTHVLVNDPTRGYGVFINTMLESAGAYEE